MVKDKQFYKQILALSLPAAFQSALSLLVVMAALGGLTLVSLALGAGVTRYFPGIALTGGRWLWVGVAAECLLMGVPVVLNGKKR